MGTGAKRVKSGKRGDRWIDALLYRMSRGFLWLVAHLVSRYMVRGREYVPEKGAVLIVSNHLSWFDPLLLGVIVRRRVWFFTKVEMFNWPLVGWLCRITGQIAVRRGASDRVALEQALAYLRDGRALVIFPEGTVERQERMIAAHSGAAMLALRAQVTIQPVALIGTRRIVRTWRSWFPKVTIQFGEPYIPALPEGMPRKQYLELVTKDIMQRIAVMVPPEGRGVYRE